MLTDDQLREQLTELAQHFVLPPIDTGRLLRRRSAARHRRTAFVAAVTVLALTAGSFAFAQSRDGKRDSLDQIANLPTPNPTSGRAWLLDVPTPRHSDGTYYDPDDEDNLPTASEPPMDNPPYARVSASLMAEVRAAGLPVGSSLSAERGELGLASVRVVLADGTPMVVMRGRYAHPIRFRASSGDGVGLQIRVEDIPGTTSAALIDPSFTYGFGSKFPPGSNGVVVVTRDGWTTSWATPSTVAMSQLRSWAFTAAASTSS